MRHWLSTPLRPLADEPLLPRDSLAGVPLDGKALCAQYREHLDGGRDFGWGLWPLLSLALWRLYYRR